MATDRGLKKKEREGGEEGGDKGREAYSHRDMLSRVCTQSKRSTLFTQLLAISLFANNKAIRTNDSVAWLRSTTYTQPTHINRSPSSYPSHCHKVNILPPTRMGKKKKW